jgi:anti-anti-sigma factor
MDITIVDGKEQVLVQVAGVIDERGAARLKIPFSQLQTTSAPLVVLDLSGVERLGSSGICRILILYKNLAIRHSRLEVVGLSPILVGLFQELKLDTLFAIAGRRDRAA